MEEVFVRFAPIVHLHVRDRVIRTTAEHPFHVLDKGWVPAGELQPGDQLVGHDGQLVAVGEVFATGEFEQVYNFRVADHHTYFVGGNEWGFSVWAHNANYGNWQKDAYGEWFAEHVTAVRNNRTGAADLLEIEHTGRINWQIEANGTRFTADGIRGGVLIDPKYVGDHARSPYIPGSACPAIVRALVLEQEVDQFRRMASLINDPTTPFTSAQIIAHHQDAVPYFERLLSQFSIPGNVIVK